MVAKRVRTHVLLPEDVIEEIDHIAGERGRSRFLTEAAQRELNRRRRVDLAKHTMGSLQDVDIPGWETSESASAWVRELRRSSDRIDMAGNAYER